MADFTTTSLAITPLLETTFISDMRIIVNSNTTVLKSKIEDIINTLQIDLVNKYIGSNLPIGKLYTQDLIVSNQMLYKAGTSGAAATIASLTQSSGVSTFTTNNLLFTRNLTATANTSKAALRTVVVGGTSGALLYPTSGGFGAPGLYVGDATRPVNAEFYGDVKFAKSSVTHSADTNVGTSGRVIGGAVRFGTGYSVLKLVLSKTDPQFMVVDIQLSDDTQNSGKPIFLQLHEDYTTLTSRPSVGQSFTIMINNILNSAGTAIATSNWPAVVATTSTDPGINIMSGWSVSSTSGTGSYKIAYINDSTWTSIPASGTSAVAAASSGMLPNGSVRLYNPAQQTGIAATAPNKLGATITLTKILQDTDYSRYVITGGNNFVYVNTPVASVTTTTAAPTTTTTTTGGTTTTTTAAPTTTTTTAAPTTTTTTAAPTTTTTTAAPTTTTTTTGP